MPLINKRFSAIFTPGGDVGVGIFFLITGYFLCKSNKYRDITKIILEVIFYSIITFVIAYIAKTFFDYDISWLDLLTQLCLPISSNNWWFITAYILLMLIIPILNKVVSFINKSRGIRTLFELCLIWLAWYLIAKVFRDPYEGLLRAVCYYIVGGSIRHHFDSNRKPKKVLCVLGFIVNWLLYAGSTYKIGMIIGSGKGSLLVANVLKFFRHGFFAPLAAICLFMLFLQVDIGSSKKINTVASTTLGIYMLHEGIAMRMLIWHRIFNVNGPISQSVLFPLYYIFVVAVIFILDVSIDLLRQKFLEHEAVERVNHILHQ